jgi:hypothetical protein
MPDYANTPIKICSRASLLIGGDAIQSFTDGTAESSVADAIYEDIARSALTNTRWRFASNQEDLVRLVAAPTGRWDAAYQIPASSLMISAVTVEEEPIKYDTYGDKIYCDAVSTDTVTADFIFRADEADWPPYFTLAVEFAVASVFAISLARDAQLGTAMENRAERQFIKARRLDSQAQTTRKLNTSRFIVERRS